MNYFANHFKKMDWLMAGSALLLSLFGLVSIYSSSGSSFLNFQKQALFLFLGFLLMVLLSFFDWRTLKEDPYLILFFYFLCLVLLAGLFFLAPEIRSVKSWYKIGSYSFDPIELLKIVLIVLLAKYFSMRHIEMYRIRHIIISGFYLFFPAALVFFQPNLGSVLVLASIWLGILMISGIKLRHFLILVILGMVLLALGWSTILKDYQKARILSFIEPQMSDPLKIGWNQRQAAIAIGSGGLMGQGIGRGSQTQYGFLPEPQTDFVFAAIAEETGLAGVAVLFILFLILIWRIVKLALQSRSNFTRIFSSVM